MAGVPDYSTTPGSNTTINSISVAEGMAPSAVNNAIRQLMADVAAQSKLETVAGTDTYTMTLDVVPAAYSTQMMLPLLFTNANTSATPTLNVNSLGAKTIKNKNGAALLAGSIAAGSVHVAWYDGTDIRLMTVDETGGTFTPAIAFGGGTTGITYTSQSGRYTRIADRVFFDLLIILSNKGSSTGDVSITGLPIAAANSANDRHTATVFGSALTGISGGLQASWTSGTAIETIQYTGTGTVAALTDANCGNTSQLRVSGHYKV